MSIREVETAIEDEEATLATVTSLLTGHRALTTWPTSARRALGVALDEATATTERSAGQARGLRRHLFGPRVTAVPIPAVARPTPQDLRRGERLRMDLPRQVRLRAAAYLAHERHPKTRPSP